MSKTLGMPALTEAVRAMPKHDDPCFDEAASLLTTEPTKLSLCQLQNACQVVEISDKGQQLARRCWSPWQS